MKNKYLPIFLFISLLAIQNVYSSGREYYKKAEYLLEVGNFKGALEIYQTLLQKNVNSANLNFKIGFCYLNMATQKSKSIPYFEFAIKNISSKYEIDDPKETKAPIEALFYLGQAYRVNYRFNDAKKVFMTLKKQIISDKKKYIPLIDHEIHYCDVAKKLIKTPVEMTVTNLGKEVNSKYTEHSPVISGDERTLIFTSKRKGVGGNEQTEDGRYYEDIFISTYKNGKFQKAEPISTNINTSGHEASIGLSFDGKKLLIYRNDNQDGNIYVSEKNQDGWSVPISMGANINSKYKETHASVSFDQNEIYFTSDRKGGYGGLDIYRVRKLPNGKWGKPQNLGADINTFYDEEGPYLHPDGTSLFFASKGHESMGGFDIFVSHYDKKNQKWGKPQNIGYPINTPDDDVFYIPSVDGRRAYYAFYANNSLGEYDIFRIDLSESHIRNQTVITGTAKLKSGKKLQDPIVTISSMNDNLVGIYTPDEVEKKFLAILPCGKSYKILFESSNADSFEKIIKVPELAYDQSHKVLILDSIEIGTNEKNIVTEQRQEQLSDVLKSENDESYQMIDSTGNHLFALTEIIDDNKSFLDKEVEKKAEEEKDVEQENNYQEEQKKEVKRQNIAKKEEDNFTEKKTKEPTLLLFKKPALGISLVVGILIFFIILLLRKNKK